MSYDLYYSRETERMIDRGIYQVCEECGRIIERGLYIGDELHCTSCARDVADSMDEDELLNCIDPDREKDISDIYVYIQKMHIYTLANHMGWDIWED